MLLAIGNIFIFLLDVSQTIDSNFPIKAPTEHHSDKYTTIFRVRHDVIDPTHGNIFCN